MARSVTMSVPPPARLARWLIWLAVGLVVIVIGIRAGQALTKQETAVALASAAPLQQIQTTSGVYLGKIVSADDDYLRLYGPAVLREQPTASGQTPQLLVIRLTTQPFDVDGDVLIPRENVILIGNVARNSALETAYRQAIGDLPPPGGAGRSPQPSVPRPTPS